MSKDMDFCHLQEIYQKNMEINYWILLLKQDQTAFKKVVHKLVEATYEIIGNKIADKIVKPKLVTSSNVEEIVILPKKGQEIL